MKKQNILFLLILTISLVGCKSKWDKQKWNKGNKTSNTNPRWEMIDDLRSNYLHEGITKEKEVDILLGTPYSKLQDPSKRIIEYKYQIGSNQGFNIDKWWLNLTFDSTGTLDVVEVAKH